ncbi:MAG: Ppx/GppA phosphatase family protein [Sulfurospirillaceae bacterium]|nr:Ppx/GppA phosphatase family protein [Sulfurospirillaceae bacterium]
MAKKTAVIDIGSNSARIAVFEKSSRFAFHLINETKSRVRLGEGAYELNGVLQDGAMQRATNSLSEFKKIIQNLKCQKTLCIATSALRDAPNSKDFIKKIKDEVGINIKIIDGKTEAYYGAIGAINYLHKIDDAVTVDIGGGSTELAKIENGNITHTISLNIGTVRLKELFFDKKSPLESIINFINKEVEKIPQEFYSKTIIGIGGTLRSLSKIIIEREKYPIKTVHAFEYEIEKQDAFISTIIASDVFGLKELGVRKDRYDTMREGCIIFQTLYKKLKSSSTITSGAGVREGAYLHDLLRNSNYTFGSNFKLSLRSLKDRFSICQNNDAYTRKIVAKLFDTLTPLHGIPSEFKEPLCVAAEVYNIGTNLNFYQANLHSFYFIINTLNYGFSHKQKALIAILTKFHTNKLPSYEEVMEFKELLPNIEVVNWLSFLLSLAKCINTDSSRGKIEFSYENHTLIIHSENRLFLAKEHIKQLTKPISFAIVIKPNT